MIIWVYNEWQYKMMKMSRILFTANVVVRLFLVRFFELLRLNWRTLMGSMRVSTGGPEDGKQILYDLRL